MQLRERESMWGTYNPLPANFPRRKKKKVCDICRMAPSERGRLVRCAAQDHQYCKLSGCPFRHIRIVSRFVGYYPKGLVDSKNSNSAIMKLEKEVCCTRMSFYLDLGRQFASIHGLSHSTCNTIPRVSFSSL